MELFLIVSGIIILLCTAEEWLRARRTERMFMLYMNSPSRQGIQHFEQFQQEMMVLKEQADKLQQFDP